MTHKILTANRLQDGLVIYLGEDGWSADPNSARRAYNDEDAAALENLGKESARKNDVADPYLIDVDDDGPVRWREVIRANGPTVRRDLGYQADRHDGGGF